MIRQLTEFVLVAPQIGVDEVTEAAARGVTLILNNRPEGESDDQTPGDAIEAAAKEAGIAYAAIPVTHAGFSGPQVAAMADALDGAHGKVLAYCRSGTRSTLLWALAEASRGADPAVLGEQAASAGYDLAPIQQMLAVLAGRAQGQ